MGHVFEMFQIAERYPTRLGLPSTTTSRHIDDDTFNPYKTSSGLTFYSMIFHTTLTILQRLYIQLQLWRITKDEPHSPSVSQRASTAAKYEYVSAPVHKVAAKNPLRGMGCLTTKHDL